MATPWTVHATREFLLASGSVEPVANITFKPIFRWYDFWVGIYVDRPGRALYVFPVPMFGLKIQFRDTTNWFSVAARRASKR